MPEEQRALSPQIPPIDMTTDHLSDACREYVVMHRDIKPIWPGACLEGAPAFTVQVPPGDNKTLFEAIDKASSGSVIVVNGGGYLGRSLWGAIMSFAAMKRGIVGLVADGLVRDRDDLERLGFPVFARGLTPISPKPRRLGAMQVPIMCGGLQVAPGDAIFADSDGVVAINATRKDEVVAKAQARAHQEDELFHLLDSGMPMTEAITRLASPSPSHAS